MATISEHSFNIGPYGKYVLKSSPLKPVSQFKAHGWSLNAQFSKLCPMTLTSIQDGRLQRTYCSFNIGPYGKKCFKIFSETSKPI
jgi:hypothetical protein